MSIVGTPFVPLCEAALMLSWHSLGMASLPDSREWLSPAEANYAARLQFTKRRGEWLLARWTAKQALAVELQLGTDIGSLAQIEIRTIIGGQAQGAPEVFVSNVRRQIGISLSDRADWAVCAVGQVDELGCDLELVEARSERFVQDFFTPVEQEAVARPPFDMSADAVANLIWSAKESALKVLRTGLRRDTRSVEVSWPSDPARDGWSPLCVRSDEQRELPGWWRRYGDFLLTIVTGSAVPPPRSLTDPPGLASAQPSHGWLDAPQ